MNDAVGRRRLSNGARRRSSRIPLFDLHLSCLVCTEVQIWSLQREPSVCFFRVNRLSDFRIFQRS